MAYLVRIGHRGGHVRTTGGVVAAAGPGIRRWRGTLRYGAAVAWRAWLGTSGCGCCKYHSHPTDACRSVGAERNPGAILRSSSSHPFRPYGRRRHCSPAFLLVSGTSDPPLRRSPVSSAGVKLWIEASRWDSCGLPDPMPSRGSPQFQQGFAVTATGGVARCFAWGDHVAGLQSSGV